MSMSAPVDVKDFCDPSPCWRSVRESTDVASAGFDCQAVRAVATRLLYLVKFVAEHVG
jgi:hypothetical protein